MHVPKHWNSSAPGFTSGGAAYPLALVRPDGSSVVSQATWGSPGTPALYDPDERVTTGILAKTLIDKTTGTALDDQPLLYGAEWKVNGRFFGVLHVPEATVRANGSPSADKPSLTAKVAKGEQACSSLPLLPWAGQSWLPERCPAPPWSADTRFPAGRLVPYTGVAIAGFKVAGGWLSLEADVSRLTIRLEPPAGRTVTVSVNLKCVASPTGVCVS